jgi:putative oxidoreductase
MSLRDFLVGPMSLDTRAGHFGLMLLRAFCGLALAFAHGRGKLPPAADLVAEVAELGFPNALLWAWLAGIAEFFGGIFLAVGLLTRAAAIVVLSSFVVVVWLAHDGDPFIIREKALIFLAASLMFAITGPGRYSLDALFLRRK